MLMLLETISKNSYQFLDINNENLDCMKWKWK